mgnify:CR=1 FL=1
MGSDREIGYEIRVLNNTIRNSINSMKLNKAIESNPHTTRLHAWVIGFVFHSKNPVYQKDIETEFQIKRSTASTLLASMEKNGLITRRSVDHDARLKQVILTDKARKMHETFLVTARKVEENLARGLSDEELRNFFSTLDKISDNARNMII